MRRDFYSMSYFYHLPKVHKDQQHPPGRSIVASMNSVTSVFSLYIDFFLQPLAQNLHSYICDSKHLLELLAPYTWEDHNSWLSPVLYIHLYSPPHRHVSHITFSIIVKYQTGSLYVRCQTFLPYAQLFF